MGMNLDKMKVWLQRRDVLCGLWLLLGLVSAILKIKSNNFLIFRGVFWHTWQGVSLYAPYPEEYFDTNHYGPLFSVIVAPFAIMPVWLGVVCWHVAMAALLYVAIRRMPIDWAKQVFVLWFCAHELLTALFMSQFNIAICALVVGAYICVEKEKDHWATFLILIGTFVKLYGIVGLAFFLFSKHKWRFVWSFAAWSVVLFALPMIISSPEYVVDQYVGWYQSLSEKNADNMFSGGTNISLLGLVRKVGALVVGRDMASAYSDMWIIVPGCVLFALPYLRFRQWASADFRAMFLCSALCFLVLFSTGSESSGYITPFVGISIWYCCVPWRRTRWDIALMVFAFILTSMSPSDLFPAYVRREIVQPYALKALPIVIIWLKMVYEMLTRDYLQTAEEASAGAATSDCVKP